MPAPALEWRRSVRADLLAIVDTISDDDPDAAQRPEDENESKVSRLPEHAKLHRVGRVVGTREMLVRPNYVVISRKLRARSPYLRVPHGARQGPTGVGYVGRAHCPGHGLAGGLWCVFLGKAWYVPPWRGIAASLRSSQ